MSYDDWLNSKFCPDDCSGCKFCNSVTDHCKFNVRFCYNSFDFNRRNNSSQLNFDF